MKILCEVIPYGGWANCVRLTNGRTELVATTDVGPRIIRYGKPGGPNFLKEFARQMGRRGGSRWRIFGGHRLWIAPEDVKRTYVPDNEPVDWSWKGKVLKLMQPPDQLTRLAKEIWISFASGGAVRIEHVITNHGRTPACFSPWALTVMAPGGEAIFPHEPYRSHRTNKLPARPLVLWPYTDMSDPRWTWGKSEFRLRQDVTRPAPQKIGFLSTQGWMAYTLGGQTFVKRHAFVPGASYPDFNCNVETFTNDEILELETLGPLVKLAKGQSTRHIETWEISTLPKRGKS